MLVLQSEKEKEALQQKLIEAKPLIDFANTIAMVDDEGILVNALAHIAQNNHNIKIGEKRLWALLREWGLIQKNNTLPTQKAQELSIFVVQERLISHHSGKQFHTTTKVNGKGQVYLIEKLKQHFEQQSA